MMNFFYAGKTEWPIEKISVSETIVRILYLFYIASSENIFFFRKYIEVPFVCFFCLISTIFNDSHIFSNSYLQLKKKTSIAICID